MNLQFMLIIVALIVVATGVDVRFGKRRLGISLLRTTLAMTFGLLIISITSSGILSGAAMPWGLAGIAVIAVVYNDLYDILTAKAKRQ